MAPLRGTRGSRLPPPRPTEPARLPRLGTGGPDAYKEGMRLVGSPGPGLWLFRGLPSTLSAARQVLRWFSSEPYRGEHMSNPSSSISSDESSDQLVTRGSAGSSDLQTSRGNTTISDSVVQKIAGVSARELSGVYALGGGTARTIGAIRDRIPGSSQSTGQGVAVEVGERQAAIDLDLVAEYGVSIVELSRAVRRNVISAVEGMTGLEVTELNVSVNDIHLPSDDQEDAQESRVQ